MQSQQNLSQFITVLTQNQQKLGKYALSLIRPKDQQEMKASSKLIFGAISKLLQQECDRSNILKISKFILMLIIAGHFHIFESFDKYFLPQLIAIGSSVLKFNSNSDQQLNIKHRYQFSSELLQLLAHWFPYDFIEQSHPSKYSKVVKKKRITIKKNMIFSLSFVQQAEKQLQRIVSTKNQACSYCIHCYEKAQFKLVNKQNNTNTIIKNDEYWNMQMADKISMRIQRNGARKINIHHNHNINNNNNNNNSNNNNINIHNNNNSNSNINTHHHLHTNIPININRNDENNQNVSNIILKKVYKQQYVQQHKEDKNGQQKRERRKVKLLRNKQQDNTVIN